MTLTKLERKALNGANDREGIKRSDSNFYGVGDRTLSILVERGLLERFPHPVSRELMYRTTPAGQEARRVPEQPKPARIRAKLTMLKPLVRTIDTRTAKPLKRS